LKYKTPLWYVNVILHDPALFESSMGHFTSPWHWYLEYSTSRRSREPTKPRRRTASTIHPLQTRYHGASSSFWIQVTHVTYQVSWYHTAVSWLRVSILWIPVYGAPGDLVVKPLLNW